MSLLGDILDFKSLEKFVDVATSVAKLATSGAAIYSEIQQVNIAKEQADLQKEELNRQKRLATLEAKRTARIAKANVIAQGAAGGIASSTLSGRVAGIGADLTSGLASLEETTAFYSNQLGVEVADVERVAVGGMISNVFTAGVETAGLLGSLLENNNNTETTNG